MTRIIDPPPGQRRAQYQTVRREVSDRYAAEFRRASLWQRFLLWHRIERETRAELKRRFPPGALYLEAPTSWGASR